VQPLSTYDDSYLECLEYLLEGRIQSKRRYFDNHSTNSRIEADVATNDLLENDEVLTEISLSIFRKKKK